MTGKIDPEKATVETIPGGYHLVTCGEWQVSVMNDGMISLPRLVRPQDVDDFCIAMAAAKEVGLTQQEENSKLEESIARETGSPLMQLQARRRQALANKDATRAEKTGQRAKSAQQARAGGPRGARKTQSKENT